MGWRPQPKQPLPVNTHWNSVLAIVPFFFVGDFGMANVANGGGGQKGLLTLFFPLPAPPPTLFSYYFLVWFFLGGFKELQKLSLLIGPHPVRGGHLIF